MRVHPVWGHTSFHRGVDLAVALGTPVRATAWGHVLSVHRGGGYGLAVEVGHRARSGLSTSTLYAHLGSVPAGLRAGVRVGRGSVVGFSGGVGRTAGVSTGPHVHYETRTGGRAVDPASLYDLAFNRPEIQVRPQTRRPVFSARNPT